MRQFTRFLKEEYNRDYNYITARNYSISRMRTKEQNLQSATDRYNHYKDKWICLLGRCETKAQKETCKMLLEKNEVFYNSNIKRIERFNF